MKAIAVPFKFDEGVVETTSNVDTIIKNQIVNYFMTTNGERVRNIGYGGNLQSLAFEINDPLILADYKIDAIPAVNQNIGRGRVIDVGILDSSTDPSTSFYDSGTATVVIRYAVAPRTVSIIKLVIDAQLTEESEI
jgi:phage baseplate assembly protein W